MAKLTEVNKRNVRKMLQNWQDTIWTEKLQLLETKLKMEPENKQQQAENVANAGNLLRQSIYFDSLMFESRYTDSRGAPV